jgi:hypothetical protein
MEGSRKGGDVFGIGMSNAFKYCDGRGIDILLNLELKITPPDQLNDVFEFSPHVICSAPRRMAKDVMRDKAAVRESYHEDKRSGGFVVLRSFRGRKSTSGAILFRVDAITSSGSRSGRACANRVEPASVVCGRECGDARGIRAARGDHSFDHDDERRRPAESRAHRICGCERDAAVDVGAMADFRKLIEGRCAGQFAALEGGGFRRPPAGENHRDVRVPLQKTDVYVENKS